MESIKNLYQNFNKEIKPLFWLHGGVNEELSSEFNEVNSCLRKAIDNGNFADGFKALLRLKKLIIFKYLEDKQAQHKLAVNFFVRNMNRTLRLVEAGDCLKNPTPQEILELKQKSKLQAGG